MLPHEINWLLTRGALTVLNKFGSCVLYRSLRTKNFPRRQKKQVFFGYSPPTSVDSVYFFEGFLDQNRHSPPISEFIPQIMGGLRPPIMTGDNSEIGGECLFLSKNPTKK